MTLTQQFRILVINPNTSVEMTEALIAPVQALQYGNTIYTYHTNPSPDGPPSINSPIDVKSSVRTILPSLEPIIDNYDAFLVACFSPHDLVAVLRSLISKTSRPRRPVTGIFEAGIAAATEYVYTAKRWVVITTAETWREPLSRGVGAVIGIDTGTGNGWDHRSGDWILGAKFGGVETTGLTAGELHGTPRDVVDRKMAEALNRICDVWETRQSKARIGAVVLGCAGMVGWDEIIRSEFEKRYAGESETDSTVLVVDPVKSGIGSLQNALRSAY